jgi:hypothetical protein
LSEQDGQQQGRSADRHLTAQQRAIDLLLFNIKKEIIYRSLSHISG